MICLGMYQEKRKFFLFGGLIFVVIFFVCGGIWFYKTQHRQPLFEESLPGDEWEIHTDNSIGIKFEYPLLFKTRDLDESDQKAGVVFRAIRDIPNALFSLRVEKDLGPLKITEGSILEALISMVNRYYPDRFPEYSKEKYDEIILANEKAALFEFTYLGEDGKTRIKQRLVIVVKDNTAYYLSAQAPEKDFSKAEKDFDQVINSFEFIQ